MLDYARSFWSFFWSWVRGFVGPGVLGSRACLCGWVTWVVPVYVKDGAGAVGFTACASLSWRVYHHEICSGVSVCGMYLGALGRGVGQRPIFNGAGATGAVPGSGTANGLESLAAQCAESAAETR